MVDAKRFLYDKGISDTRRGGLTPAMEDYLEMLCRLMETHTVVRLGSWRKSSM